MRRQDSNLQPSGHEPDEITISLLRNLSTGCPVFVFDEGIFVAHLCLGRRTKPAFEGASNLRGLS